jgi:hypothetical protein
MSIGIAIFASVVLLLVVYHKTFRKVFFWTAGIAAIGCGLFYGRLYLYLIHEEKVEAKKQAELHAAAVKTCIARFPDHNPVNDMLCDLDVNTQPAPPPPADSTADSEKVTCELLREYAPNDYLFDGLGHCTPKARKKTSAPKIIATIGGPYCANSESGLVLWSNPSGESRRALLKFEGGEQVDYVGKEMGGDAIVRYRGIKGYIDHSCMRINSKEAP